jgi:hypothetical protein
MSEDNLELNLLTDLEKIDISKLGGLDVVPMYNIYGHLDTPYLISRFAGRSENDSLWLSFYSEYPDESKDFSATGQFFNFGEDWRSFIYNKVHSLHGGNHKKIQKRRSDLKNAIAQALNEPNIRKAGLLIHALGDSYAHTKGKLNTTEETAYGEIVGHGLASICFHDPDKAFRISNRDKYIEFITELFELLKTENADEVKFRNYVDQVKGASCTKDDCAINELNLVAEHKKIHNFLFQNLHTIPSIQEEELLSTFALIQD